LGKPNKMFNSKIQNEILDRTEKLLESLPKERLREVIKRRFGLIDGNQETLESIGKSYDITRERVRQIEKDALKILTERGNLLVLKPVFNHFDKIFREHHLIREERFLSEVSGFSTTHPVRSAVYLILTIGTSYQRVVEDHKFYTHWLMRIEARKKAETVIDYLLRHFQRHNRPFYLEEVVTFIKSRYEKIPEKLVYNSIDASKHIEQNVFGELGLVHWPEINPKGVRDKAYLVLKKAGEPQHFTKIADLINKTSLSSRPAHPQTVHNELIKDSRFVLVGRGIYALVEWGYEPGAVKDVIIKILAKAKKPLHREEIISAVLEQRKVKRNTILINLQSNKEFQRLEDGRYILNA